MEIEHWQKIMGRKTDRRSAMSGAAAAGLGIAAISLVGCGGDSAKPAAATPSPVATATLAATPTSEADAAIKAIEALGAKWDRVWNGELDLVKECVAPQYARHDATGDRVVTPESYSTEIAAIRDTVAGLQITTHQTSIAPPYWWARWSMTGTAKANGAPFLLPGMQVYRIEAGKLAETWTINLTQPNKWPETGQAAAAAATPAASPAANAEEARKAIEALYTKWTDRVWNGGELDLVKECAAPQYARHDYKGDRTVTPEAYAAEIGGSRQAIAGLKLTNHLVTAAPPYLWSRWSITGKANGAPLVLTGLQLYRIEGGKLAETWAVQQSTRWPETPA